MVANNKKYAFLFPGQGSQYPGMALDFFDAVPKVQELFALASSSTGFDMYKLIAESDASALKRTDYAQPAITLANLAVFTALTEHGLRPAAVAGHSLGEYAALAAAGVLRGEDCFALVRARGEAMHKAAESGPDGAGMAAVIGLAPEAVEELITRWTREGLDGLYAANFNAPDQTVIAGTREALSEAETRFKAAGARRLLRLNVSGAFHSPLMRGAADAFSAVLDTVVFNDPVLPFYSNVSGQAVTSGGEAKTLALRQITAPVRWTKEEAALAALPLDGVLELGPGKVLSGLWQKSGSTLPCQSIEKYPHIETFLTASQ